MLLHPSRSEDSVIHYSFSATSPPTVAHVLAEEHETPDSPEYSMPGTLGEARSCQVSPSHPSAMPTYDVGVFWL